AGLDPASAVAPSLASPSSAPASPRASSEATEPSVDSFAALASGVAFEGALPSGAVSWTSSVLDSSSTGATQALSAAETKTLSRGLTYFILCYLSFLTASIDANSLATIP